MTIISPIEFKQAFLRVVSELEHELLLSWSNGSEYTAIIRAKVLPEIAGELGLKAYCEKDYYWLDAIFYEQRDTVHFQDETTYAEYIAVAVEHENLPSGTVVEMNKLQIFNTPLKVLITYAGNSGIQDLLSKYTRIMAGADVFGDFSDKRRQLVIFGPPGKSAPSSISWTFFTYENDRFVMV